MDAKLVQQEISELSGLTVEQLDIAANQILKRSVSLRSNRGKKKSLQYLDNTRLRSNSCKERKRVKRRWRKDSIGLSNSFNYNKLQNENSSSKKLVLKKKFLGDEVWGRNKRRASERLLGCPVPWQEYKQMSHPLLNSPSIYQYFLKSSPTEVIEAAFDVAAPTATTTSTISKTSCTTSQPPIKYQPSPLHFTRISLTSPSPPPPVPPSSSPLPQLPPSHPLSSPKPPFSSPPSLTQIVPLKSSPLNLPKTSLPSSPKIPHSSTQPSQKDQKTRVDKVAKNAKESQKVENKEDDRKKSSGHKNEDTSYVTSVWRHI